MLHSLLAFVALLLIGCTAAVYTSYQIATDQRSLEVQHLDTGIAGTIKARLLESDVKGAGWRPSPSPTAWRANWNLKASQVSTSVLAGHVVLVGVVDHADKVKKILDYARATGGGVVVKSFIQVAPS